MIKRRPRVLYAIIDYAEYIGRRSLSSAERFFDGVEETFLQLERMPGLGHPYQSDDDRLAGIRVWPVKGFRNHLVFYRPIDGGVEILHLIHGARDIPAVLAEELREGPS